MEENEVNCTVNAKEDLPTSIVIKNAPKDLFENNKLKENFFELFRDIDPDVRIEYIKQFQRIRVAFKEPEHATTAKLLVEHHSFHGANMKAYFLQNIKLKKRTYQDKEGHLTLPTLEKQFLISPPSSPPVGWAQSIEMAPVICDFDLMARLAAFTVDEKYELHSGEKGQPAIIITPCTSADNALDYTKIDNYTTESYTSKILPTARPKTPRLPK